MRRVLAVVTVAVVLVGCGGSDASPDASPEIEAPAGPTPAAGSPTNCLVRLHGKGGAGQSTVETVDASGTDVRIVAPTGNADGWGARQWLYFPDADYDRARAIVETAITGCSRVIINGFSNGGSFAAKLLCRGETFDARLVRVVIDDPVVDSGVDGCSPDPAVDLVLYWTGALDETAAPGWDCAEGDWTCEGGTTIGITAYADALATTVQASPNSDHEWYLDAPELSEW